MNAEVIWGRNELAGVKDRAPSRRPIFAEPSGDGGGSNYPFQVVAASTVSQAKVLVKFGQVNSITPANLDTAFNVASGVVYLAVVFNVSGVVTSASVASAASLPADDSTHGYITLATVTVSGVNVAISQSVTHSLGVQRAGVSYIHFWGV